MLTTNFSPLATDYGKELQIIDAMSVPDQVQQLTVVDFNMMSLKNIASLFPALEGWLIQRGCISPSRSI